MDASNLPDHSSDDAGLSFVADSLSDLYCDPCREDGTHIQAEGYCVDCAHNLCGTCFLHHCKPKPCRNHKLIDKRRQKDTSGKSYNPDECVDKCLTHKEEIVRFFCEEHELFGCSICITVGHRNCRVGYIPTLSDDLFDSHEYRDFKRVLESLADSTKSLQESLTRNIEYVSQHAKRAIYRIRRFRKEIETFFDDLERKISDEVVKTQYTDQKEIKDISKQCKALTGLIADLKADIEDKESKSQKCRLFFDLKQLPETMNKCKQRIKYMEKSNIIKDLSFKPSTLMSSLISDQSELFGSLVDFCQTISVTSSREKHCNITDIAILTGERIAVIDAYNDCVKVIDTTRDRVISSMALPKYSGYTTGITAISNSEFAVSYGDKIELYLVKDRMRLTKTIRCPLYGPGFLYINKTFIGFTSSPLPTLCKTNLNGDVVKTFPTDLGGKSVLQDPRYIAVNLEQSAIYISDSAKETVTCVTLNGKVKSQYRPTSEWSPKGVVVSRDGLVYVCDSHSNNIFILTSDLKELGQLNGEKYKMRNSQGIAYSAQENRLYVGNYNTTLRVFNI